ncbi:uncharacterized protein [Setaria viridis]|uniref:uncharacterized protein isoform X4 n=1 Tax=Setaria viridis TaxID=4556 RepID=UPI003B3B7E5B
MAKAHILVLPFPAQGHVTPLMELSHRLVDHGFEVTFVNTEAHHALVVGALQAAGGTSALAGIHLASISDGVEDDEDRKDISKLVDTYARHMPGHLERLVAEMEAAGRPKVKWLVSDVYAWWSLNVAKRLARAGRDVPTCPRDPAAPHVAAAVEQRRRAGGAAHHLRAVHPDRQAQRPRRDGGVQLLPRGRGRRVQAPAARPAHRPAVLRQGVPEARRAVTAGGHPVPPVARRPARRLRRVRGVRQLHRLRPVPVPGARAGAGAHRPAVPLGGAPELHDRRAEQGVVRRVPGPRRRQGHGGQLVPPAAGPGAPCGGVLRVALRVELDDGGCQERPAVPVLALLRRPVPGPELRHRRVEDRPGGVARRGRNRDEGGAEEQGGAGRR